MLPVGYGDRLVSFSLSCGLAIVEGIGGSGDLFL
jgi:hypothetical protein